MRRLGIAALALFVSSSFVSGAVARSTTARVRPTSVYAKAKCPGIPGGTGILPDGDFSRTRDQGGAETTYDKSPKFAPHWKVAKGNVDFSGSHFYGISWYCSVDLDGYFTVGGIRARFATAPGTTYSVSFLLSGNGGYPPTVKTMLLSAAGQSQTFTWDTSNNNDIEDGEYAPESWSFQATSPVTTLRFISEDPRGSSRGAVIAGVAVTATGS
jgi:hypothetical protein